MLIGIIIFSLVLIFAILQIILYALNWLQEEKLKALYRFVDSGRFTEAATIIKTSHPPLKKSAKSKYYYYCIKCLYHFKAYDEIEENYKKILALGDIQKDWLSEIYEILADISLSKEEPKSAENYLLLSIDSNKNYPKAYSKLALVYVKLDAVSKAINTLKMGIQNNPQAIEIYETLGDIYIEKDALSDAELTFSQALTINEIHPYANYGMARALTLQKKDYSKALNYIEYALKDSKIYYDCLATRIKINFTLKEYHKVINDAEKYIKVVTASNQSSKIEIETLYTIGLAYEKINSIEKALKIFQSIDQTYKQYKDIPIKIAFNKKLIEHPALLDFYRADIETFIEYCTKILIDQGHSDIAINYSDEHRSDFLTQETTSVFVKSTRFYISFIRIPETIPLELIDSMLTASKKNVKIEKMQLYSLSTPTMEVLDYARQKNIEILPQPHVFELIEHIVGKTSSPEKNKQ